MGSKGIVIFGLFLAVVLLISSEVLAARELHETSNTIDKSKENEKTNGAADNDAKNLGGGYGGYPGGQYGGFPGGGYPGGQYGGYPGGGFPGGGYPGRPWFGGGYPGGRPWFGGGFPGGGGGFPGGGRPCPLGYYCCGPPTLGGGCSRCCPRPRIGSPFAEFEAEPQN